MVNQQLRRSYIDDCAKGVRRWNRILDQNGVDFQLKLPHEAFHRQVGLYQEEFVTPEGTITSQDEWNDVASNFLPTDSDRDFVLSLMQPVYEQGQMASWISPPTTGIHTQGIDYDYVRL